MSDEQRPATGYVARINRLEALVDDIGPRLFSVERRLHSLEGATAPAAPAASGTAEFVSTLGPVTQITPRTQAPVDTLEPVMPAEPSVPAEDVVPVETLETEVPDIPVPEDEPEADQSPQPRSIRPTPSAPSEFDWEKLVSGRGLAWGAASPSCSARSTS